jgi:hypothetical protein
LSADAYLIYILFGNPEGKRPLGRSRRRWKDIRMGLREIGLEGLEWLGSSGAG